MTKQISRRALTIKEAADYACVSRGTILQWITKRTLPYEELPGNGTGTNRFIRIRKGDLDKLLNNSYMVEKTVEKENSKSDLFLYPKRA
ncbi:helix-turn-helix domain-containing protein [candidate division KSB1 bacterium]